MPFFQNGSSALQSQVSAIQQGVSALPVHWMPFSKNVVRWGAGLGLSAALVGCGSVLPKPQAAPSLFDFGSVSVSAAVSANTNSQPQVLDQRPIFIPPVAASGLPANTQVMLYRLNYAEDMQLRGYQQSRWSQPVEQLVAGQLRKELAQQRPVLSAGLNVNFGRGNASKVPAILHVNLQRFEQVFSAPTTSAAIFQAEVTLVEPGIQGDRLLGQRVFDYGVVAESADAVGAAKALAQASTQFTADVRVWVAQLLAHSVEAKP